MMAVTELYFACVYLVCISSSIIPSCSSLFVSLFFLLHFNQYLKSLHHGRIRNCQTHVRVSQALSFRVHRPAPHRSEQAFLYQIDEQPHVKAAASRGSAIPPHQAPHPSPATMPCRFDATRCISPARMHRDLARRPARKTCA